MENLNFLNTLKREFVHYYRLKSKRTLRDFAESSGVSLTAYNDFEKGNRPFSDSIFFKILLLHNIAFDDSLESYYEVRDALYSLYDSWLLGVPNGLSRLNDFLTKYKSRFNSLSFYLLLNAKHLLDLYHDQYFNQRWKWTDSVYQQIKNLDPVAYMELYVSRIVFGEAYGQIQNFACELDHIKSTIVEISQFKSSELSNVYVGLCGYYYQQKSLEIFEKDGLSCLSVLQQASELFLEAGYLKRYIGTIELKAAFYADYGKFDTAHKFHLVAARLAKQCNDENRLTMINANLAYDLLLSEKYKEASTFAQNNIKSGSTYSLDYATVIVSSFFLKNFDTLHEYVNLFKNDCKSIKAMDDSLVNIVMFSMHDSENELDEYLQNNVDFKKSADSEQGNLLLLKIVIECFKRKNDLDRYYFYREKFYEYLESRR